MSGSHMRLHMLSRREAQFAPGTTTDFTIVGSPRGSLYDWYRYAGGRANAAASIRGIGVFVGGIVDREVFVR